VAGSTYGFRCIGLGKLIEHFASRAWSLKPGNLPASASEIVLVAFYVSLVANHVEHMKRQIRNSTENHESESNPLQHAEKSIIGGASPLSMFLALWYREQLSAEQIAAVNIFPEDYENNLIGSGSSASPLHPAGFFAGR